MGHGVPLNPPMGWALGYPSEDPGKELVRGGTGGGSPGLLLSILTSAVFKVGTYVDCSVTATMFLSVGSQDKFIQ